LQQQQQLAAQPPQQVQPATPATPQQLQAQQQQQLATRNQLQLRLNEMKQQYQVLCVPLCFVMQCSCVRVSAFIFL